MSLQYVKNGPRRQGTHSAGLLIDDSSELVTVHHTLLAHNSFRNPLVSQGGTHEFVKNLVYDWNEIPDEIFDLQSNTFHNFIGNTYREGPSTTCKGRELLINPGKDGCPADFPEGQHRARSPGLGGR